MKTQLLMILHNNRYRIMIYIDNSVSLTAGSAIATETRHFANLTLHVNTKFVATFNPLVHAVTIENI